MHPSRGARWRGGRVRLKATVSKTVMGHWPIESSNLSLSANPRRALAASGDATSTLDRALKGPREGANHSERILNRLFAEAAGPDQNDLKQVVVMDKVDPEEAA